MISAPHKHVNCTIASPLASSPTKEATSSGRSVNRRSSLPTTEDGAAAKRRASLQYQQQKFNPQSSSSFKKLSTRNAKDGKKKTFGGTQSHTSSTSSGTMVVPLTLTAVQITVRPCTENHQAPTALGRRSSLPPSFAGLDFSTPSERKQRKATLVRRARCQLQSTLCNFWAAPHFSSCLAAACKSAQEARGEALWEMWGGGAAWRLRRVTERPWRSQGGTYPTASID